MDKFSSVQLRSPSVLENSFLFLFFFFFSRLAAFVSAALPCFNEEGEDRKENKQFICFLIMKGLLRKNHEVATSKDVKAI